MRELEKISLYPRLAVREMNAKIKVVVPSGVLNQILLVMFMLLELEEVMN